MKWIVVKTKKNNENRAASNLINQGFQTFFPKFHQQKKLVNKIRLILKPLFPGYLFVNLKTNQSWNKINNTYGVSYILMNEGKLSFLPENIFAEIKNNCDHNDVMHNKNKMIKGERVILKENRLFSCEAIFHEYIESNRVVILLNLLNNRIKTVTNINQIHNFYNV